MTRGTWRAAVLCTATACARSCEPASTAEPAPADEPKLIRWTDVTLGFFHGCGIRPNGDIQCWSGAPIPVHDTGGDTVMDGSLVGTFPGPFTSVALNHPYPHPGYAETVCGVRAAGDVLCVGGMR